MEWIEIPIPPSFRGGQGGQTLHYLKVDDSWSVFIIEVSDDAVISGGMVMGPMGPMPMSSPPAGRAKWIITYEDNEMSAGMSKSLGTAKVVSMTVLHALMDGPGVDSSSPDHSESKRNN